MTTIPRPTRRSWRPWRPRVGGCGWPTWTSPPSSSRWAWSTRRRGRPSLRSSWRSPSWDGHAVQFCAHLASLILLITNNLDPVDFIEISVPSFWALQISVIWHRILVTNYARVFRSSWFHRVWKYRVFSCEYSIPNPNCFAFIFGLPNQTVWYGIIFSSKTTYRYSWFHRDLKQHVFPVSISTCFVFILGLLNQTAWYSMVFLVTNNLNSVDFTEI